MPDSSDSQLQEKVMSIVLAGGQGTRLYPLTLTRCKLQFLLGEISIDRYSYSNSLNSKIRKIFVISQYFASGLQKHLSATYIHNAISDQNLAMLCPEETSEGIQWFKGTADAVRKNLRYLQDPNIEYYLILSGDQLYNIDLLQMVTFAKKTDADLVIASFTVLEKEAKRMGLLKIDANHQIV